MKKIKRKAKRFLWCVFLIALVLLMGYYLMNRETNKEKINNKEEIKEETKSKNDEEHKKKDDPLASFRNTSNFKLENSDRYLAYKEAHSDYDYEKIVTYVNIGLDKDFYSFISDADMSKGVLILMNKYFKLPDDYEPDDLEEISSEYFINGNEYVRELRKEAKEAFERLSKDSIEAGFPVYGQSAYRPYSMQSKLYDSAVSSLGQSHADLDTARPGHSEHQTGLAIDVASSKGGDMLNFDATDSFDWMQSNAHKYGFILRYRDDKPNITGFMYESWHYRYVGVQVATDMHDNYPDLSYEEYYYKFIDKK